MKRVLFAALVVAISFGWGGVYAVQVKKETAPSTLGWCCKKGKVYKTTKNACPAKAPFGADRLAVEKACAVQQSGHCLIEDHIVSLTKARCKSVNGFFFIQRKQAEKALLAQEGWCIDRNNLLQITRVRCTERKAAFFLEESDARKAFGTQKGWCYKNLKLQEGTRNSCLSQRGDFHTEKKAAAKQLKLALTAQKITQKKSGISKGLPSASPKKGLKSAPGMVAVPEKQPGVKTAGAVSQKKTAASLRIVDKPKLKKAPTISMTPALHTT